MFLVTDVLVYLLLHVVTSQYDYSFQQGYNQHYPTHAAYYDEYDDNKYNWRKGKVGRFTNIKRKHHKRSKHRLSQYYDSSDSEYDRTKCKCSCKRCDNLQPCCRSICYNCNPDPGLVLVPYPVPLIIHVTSIKPNDTSNETVASTITTITTTTTMATTTISTTTTTTSVKTQNTTESNTSEADQEYSYEDKSTVPVTEAFMGVKLKRSTKQNRCPEITNNCLDRHKILRRNNFNPYAVTRKRFHHNSFLVRPTVPNKIMPLKNSATNSIPKYGIIPIPKQFAKKFMEGIRLMYSAEEIDLKKKINQNPFLNQNTHQK